MVTARSTTTPPTTELGQIPHPPSLPRLSRRAGRSRRDPPSIQTEKTYPSLHRPRELWSHHPIPQPSPQRGRRSRRHSRDRAGPYSLKNQPSRRSPSSRIRSFLRPPAMRDHGRRAQRPDGYRIDAARLGAGAGHPTRQRGIGVLAEAAGWPGQREGGV